MKKLGLIGKDIEYSFSKQYFSTKFKKEGISDWSYELYSFDHINQLPQLLKAKPLLVGLNVTIPYKKDVLRYLHQAEETALKIGAVNTISVVDKKLFGYNTDILGFKKALIEFVGDKLTDLKTLVLGTGGASQAIIFVLAQLGIPYKLVSRSSSKGLTYDSLDKGIISDHHLIINCTPLGTYPNVDEAVDIPYSHISEEHFLFDLVYNPQKSLFLQRGEKNGANILNGYKMLEIQAEEAWKIWKNTNISR